MACACIDVGSNTTRLLVAEVGGGGGGDADSGSGGGALRELGAERVFTRLGGDLVRLGAISEEKVAQTAEVVAAQAARARELGAERTVVVATAAIRRAANRDALAAAVEARSGLPVWVLADEEEARLSFLGATRTFSEPLAGAVAVVDVGGGSTEMAVGTVAGGVEWSRSCPIGSGLLAGAHPCSDPPSEPEIEVLRRHVRDALAGDLTPPRAVDRAIAVGGSASSLRRLLGAQLTGETLARGLSALRSAPRAELARSHGIELERICLLPGGIAIFEALAERLALPLEIAWGGLREGVILELEEAGA